MTSLLFEHFWLLLVLCVVTWAILAAIYTQRSTVVWRRTVVISLVAFALLLTMNGLVTTDREGIRQCIDQLVGACENADMPAFRNLVADDFDSDGMNKDAIVLAAKDTFRLYRIQLLVMSRRQITPPVAELTAFTKIFSRSSNDEIIPVQSTWELTFAETPTGWKLRSAKIKTFGDRSISNLHEAVNLGF
jgi:hypothetical protein